MNRFLQKASCSFFLIAVLAVSAGSAQNYPSPGQLVNEFESLVRANANKARIHELATSPGGNPIIVLELGTEVRQSEKTKPAIFVVANPEGLHPISSRASQLLAMKLLGNNNNLDFTWYILPVLNPDAYARFFGQVKWENPRNALRVNDDQDEATDEDGPDDLNLDGYITSMRVRDPLGRWIPDANEPQLMRQADRTKGEKGVYSLFVEGLDNDSDGQFNEDPPGGVNTGINFPHLFQAFAPAAGLWPGSTPEVYALMRFIYNHPEIAATFTFGSTNFCLLPPEGGRKSTSDFENISIPENFVEMFGAEKDKKYSMDEIIEMVQPMVPAGVELTPAMVASFLGLGGVVNPLPEDLVWYKELSDQYLEFLKKSGYNTERLEPEKAKDGSFELWSYYQLGIPTFSMNFFTIPKVKEEKKESSGITIEQLENMTAEELIGMGEDKINAFLKESGAPEQFKASQVIAMMKSGQASPRQMAGMMKSMPKPVAAAETDPKMKALLAYSDNVMGGAGYVNWQAFNHPDLGEVEIGGATPYVFTTPPFDAADSIIGKQLPWIITLSEKLPKLVISEYKVKSLGGSVYTLDIWIENTRYLPFPTAMGKRNNQPAPAILLLESEGMDVLQGFARTPISSVEGMQSVKVSYLIRMEKGKTLRATLTSKFAGTDNKEIKL